MAGKPVRISILADASDAVKGFDKAGASAKEAGNKFEGLADSSDGVASKGAQAAGALSGLGDLIGGKFGGAMQVAGVGMQAAADAGDLLNVAVEGGRAVMGKAVGVVKALGKAETYAAGAKKASAVAQRILNAAMRANPIGIVITAIILLVGAFVLAYKKSETFRKIVDKSWKAIKNATKAVWNWIRNATKKTWEFIKNIFKNFTGPGIIIKHWDKIKRVTRAAWDAVKNAIKAAFDKIVSTARSIGEKVKDAVVRAWTAVRDRTREAWQRVVEFVRDFIGRLVDNVRGLKDRVTGALSGAASWLYNAGKDLIRGLINGVADMAGALIDKVSGVVGGAISKAKNLLGISSPSRVFAEFGKYTVEGLVVGLERNAGKAAQASGDLARDVADGFSAPELSARTAYSMSKADAARGGNTYNIDVTAPPGTSPAQIGKTIKQYIEAYERSGGRK